MLLRIAQATKKILGVVQIKKLALSILQFYDAATSSEKEFT